MKTACDGWCALKADKTFWFYFHIRLWIDNTLTLFKIEKIQRIYIVKILFPSYQFSQISPVLFIGFLGILPERI